MVDGRQGRRVLLAGLIDSFGLSLGWTTFTLMTVERQGLSTAALYNAAMLIGIVVSAPATMWLSRYLSGGALLRLVGAVELPLRLLTLAAPALGLSPAMTAAVIVVMNVAAWTGYAGMRAEVARCDPGSTSMVRYAVAIASIEAVGASVAALLPVTSKLAAGHIAVTVVFLLYGASLAPQFWCAHNARVASGRQLAAAGSTTATELGLGVDSSAPAARLTAPLLLLAGTAVMLVASGPATLNTALAADLYGHLSVIAASIAFSLGCISATRITSWVSGRRVGTTTMWTLWAVGMLIGWLVAPLHLLGLILAQILSGLSLTAFHGEMDSAVSKVASPERLTTLLAVAGALRAIGSAVAVRFLPILVGSFGLVRYSGGLLTVVVGAALLILLLAATRRRARADHASGWNGHGPLGTVATAVRR
jgi:hypothetical protein